MTVREPSRLPPRIENWDEWREFYSGYRQEFVTEQIDRIRYLAYLKLLGMSDDDCEAEIADAFIARKAWRDNDRGA